MKDVKADDEVFYCAEGGVAQPFAGPFKSRVVRVHEDGSTIDLLVVFSPAAVRSKHGVPFSEIPAKHHWSWPDSFSSDD